MPLFLLPYLYSQLALSSVAHFWAEPLALQPEE
jgi:hypothetical protein